MKENKVEVVLSTLKELSVSEKWFLSDQLHYVLSLKEGNLNDYRIEVHKKEIVFRSKTGSILFFTEDLETYNHIKKLAEDCCVSNSFHLLGDIYE